MLQICKYSWHLRGELKVAARKLVEATYRFRHSTRVSKQLAVRARAAMLRTEDAFVYRVCQSCLFVYL